MRKIIKNEPNGSHNNIDVIFEENEEEEVAIKMYPCHNQ